MDYSDEFIKRILTEVRVIAIVGLSINPIRPSYYVAKYLKMKGFDIIPVNPRFAGQVIFGKVVMSCLGDIKRPVDMVDIFRRSDAVPEIFKEAVSHLHGLKIIWMQLGIENSKVAKQAESLGLTVVQDRCPKIEYQRLFGELRMGGFATGLISSKLSI
ncbi:MAG: CoA-binding protein [Aestuariivita sp.]|nr:CoA-binding protein [Aestuariivita sp.]